MSLERVDQKALEAAAEGLPDLWIFLDKKDLICGWNPTAEAVFPELTAQARGQKPDQVLGDLLRHLNRGEQRDNLYFTRMVQEKLEYFHVARQDLWDRKNKHLGKLISLRSRTEVFILGEQLRHSVSIDAVTGIWNRRHWLQQAEMERSRALRYQRPFTLMLLGLNNFKQYNERRGNLQGDELLRTVSRYLDRTLRSTDLLGRFGGAEFSILLPETPLSFGEPLARRIAEALEKEVAAVDSGETGVSLSMGIKAASGDITPPLEELLKEADQQLADQRRRLTVSP